MPNCSATDPMNVLIAMHEDNPMEALRFITEPVNDQVAAPEPTARLKPSLRLAGTVILHDDLITPACPEEYWEALR